MTLTQFVVIMSSSTCLDPCFIMLIIGVTTPFCNVPFLQSSMPLFTCTTYNAQCMRKCKTHCTHTHPVNVILLKHMLRLHPFAYIVVRLTSLRFHDGYYITSVYLASLVLIFDILIPPLTAYMPLYNVVYPYPTLLFFDDKVCTYRTTHFSDISFTPALLYAFFTHTYVY